MLFRSATILLFEQLRGLVRYKICIYIYTLAVVSLDRQKANGSFENVNFSRHGFSEEGIHVKSEIYKFFKEQNVVL